MPRLNEEKGNLIPRFRRSALNLTMTPEEMRIAIAEKCGIKCLHCNNTGIKKEPSFGNPTVMVESPCRHQYLPDYCNDLNAIIEAERTALDNCNGRDFIEKLCEIRGGWEHNTWFDIFTHSTAAQRCEAFCRLFWPERFKA